MSEQPKFLTENCCVRCHEAALRVQYGDRWWLYRLMVVCPDCGNKRCPKATDHRLPCTDSNEPGQPGSVYGAFNEETR